MRRRIDLERVGAWTLAVLTLVTLVVVTVSALLRVAADDLYTAADAARGTRDGSSRTVYGRWLSAELAPDVSDAGYQELHARADELSFRSDRLREVAAVPAVIGLLTALLTDVPEPLDRVRPRRPGQPAAQRGSNGTA